MKEGWLDTKLEAEGAEFLVLGALLVERIAAYKTYTNMPGYDLVATHPERNRSARIQVKSRWATDYDGGWPMRNLDCDFVVFVALNRGFRYARKRADAPPEDGKKPPEFYVFPIEVIRAAKDARRVSQWGKVYRRDIPNATSYIERWDLIRQFLEKAP
jgi:hypothetical protein